MEQMTREESEQTVKGTNVQPTVEKPSDPEASTLSRTPEKANETVPIEHKTESNILSRTPAKENETVPSTLKAEVAEIPEKYKSISNFFDHMTSSVRLLSMRKKSPTFTNICRQVEILSGRKFSYKHLAQVKFILPEAVQTEKILVHDEKTMCMNPELIITLLFDIVKGHDKEQSDYSALRMIFASRLCDFYSSHPESYEIPEAALPEPFNKGNITMTSDTLPVDSSGVAEPNSIHAEPLNSSHLYPSFNRFFSQKDLLEETEKTQLLASRKDLVKETEESQLLASSTPGVSNKHDSLMYHDAEQQSASTDSRVEPNIAKTPVKLTNPPCESTPIKFTSKSEKLMVVTPAQLTPQRSQPSCDRLKTTSILKRTPSSLSAKRTLSFTYSESEDTFSKATGDGIFQFEVTANITPQGETESVIEENQTASLAASLPKVSSCCSSRDNVIKQMSCCLPDLVPIIDQIFRRATYSSMTKDELVQKIIMNALDIVERREVEDQIDELEKVVPDWIGKTLEPSGDILYKIKKVADLKSVCERLICV